MRGEQADVDNDGVGTTTDPAVDGGTSVIVRRRRFALIVAVTSALLATAGLIASNWVKSPAQLAAETRPPAPTLLTSTVERRVLTDTLVTRGQVAATVTLEVTPVAASKETAAQVVTAVRISPGKRIEAGDVLLEVSGRPLIALAGATPAYRDLRPGTEGNDIAQLQKALRALGLYTSADQTGYFGPATKQAVRRLYDKVGHEPADTGGPGGLGDREALSGAAAAVETAQRAVDAMKRRMAAQGSAPAPPGEEPLSTQLSYLQRAREQAKRAHRELMARTGPMVPLAEVVFLPSFPGSVAQFSAKVGDTVKAPLLTLSAGALGATARLRPDQANLIKLGMKVDIIGEGIGAQTTGKIKTIGAVTTDTQPAAGADAGAAGGATTPYVPVTVMPDKPLEAEWAGQDVRLTITSAQSADEVLVVPISAVFSSADSRTTVSKVLSDGKIARVPVEAGISGDGFVQVTAVNGDLDVGDQVVVGK